jgi:hypothetical protein
MTVEARRGSRAAPANRTDPRRAAEARDSVEDVVGQRVARRNTLVTAGFGPTPLNLPMKDWCATGRGS